MQTRPPSIARVMIAVGFAISCFAIALFLWLAFGGPTPLKPEGYRFAASFDEATQLVSQSDVRISGVSVGTVQRVDLDAAGRAEATIELDGEHAPIPVDTRAILRQKTLLGEIYVELTPGDADSGMLEEDGTLPATQVADTVQLDEIFRAFDEPTREAFRAWMQGQAAALRGRGADFSVAIASLPGFAREADRLLRVLDSQRRGVREFVRGGGEVFGALAERSGQLRGLIENGAAVFETTAQRNDDLAAAFVAFPTFLRESRATLTRLDQFARDTQPVVNQLRPAVRELGPTVDELGRLAPQLEGFFVGLRRATRVAPSGFRGLRRLLDGDLPPLLDRVETFLPQLNAILEGIRRYRGEVTALLGNAAAATNAGLELVDPATGFRRRVIRTLAQLNPEVVSVYPNRLRINRPNPYVAPGGLERLRQGLASFETRQCADGIAATLNPLTPTMPAFLERVDGDPEEAEDLFNRIREFAFTGQLNTDDLPTPPCIEQPPFESIGAPPERSDYLHVRPLP
jgi:phospholipid/cholesterol/gamma-HCH transport system substrate-binding protein